MMGDTEEIAPIINYIPWILIIRTENHSFSTILIDNDSRLFAFLFLFKPELVLRQSVLLVKENYVNIYSLVKFFSASKPHI